MDFDLFNSYPESQLDLMSTMLQLEQLTALSDQSLFMAAPTSPPVSPMGTPSPQFSPPPQMSVTTTTAGGGYQDQYNSMPATYGAGAGVHQLDFAMSSPGSDSGAPQGSSSSSSSEAMREMIFHIAALQPVEIDPEAVRPPKRRNVRISKDPQSVAARLRRERISERIRILQRPRPGPAPRWTPPPCSTRPSTTSSSSSPRCSPSRAPPPPPEPPPTAPPHSAPPTQLPYPCSTTLRGSCTLLAPTWIDGDETIVSHYYRVSHACRRRRRRSINHHCCCCSMHDHMHV
ncbi:hypothetical protein OsJ_29617 [Oryza sativa Japonica Group]|uniref:BHLH domain-containing protein n=1 Tax=Oryza sativa subsp. japonica TaxID=39947 RepID=A3BZI5_ORYSJ|nr:hypothetical protein OsJ_29617 [Oryza sativa Japonica Group]